MELQYLDAVSLFRIFDRVTTLTTSAGPGKLAQPSLQGALLS